MSRRCHRSSVKIYSFVGSTQQKYRSLASMIFVIYPRDDPDTFWEECSVLQLECRIAFTESSMLRSSTSERSFRLYVLRRSASSYPAKISASTLHGAIRESSIMKRILRRSIFQPPLALQRALRAGRRHPGDDRPDGPRGRGRRAIAGGADGAAVRGRVRPVSPHSRKSERLQITVVTSAEIG